MMTEAHSWVKLTPARLALLRDAEAGHVEWWPSVMGDPAQSRLSRPGERYRVVTAAVEKLRAGGLVRLPHRNLGDFGPLKWVLTEAGRNELRNR